jgi:Protein of unknown function (DUF1612)/HTH DNA binding domain
MIEYDVEDLAKKLDLKRLLKPLLSAEQAVARTDERLRVMPFRDGVIERVVYHEACAISLLEGKLVPAEDLVQFEAGVLQKVSYPELSACHSAYLILRHAWRAAPEALLGGASPGDGRERQRMSEEQRNEFVYDQTWGEAERLGAWASARRAADALPALLTAAFIWDAWNSLQPEQRGLWKSWLLASLTLKARKAFGQGLLPLGWGAAHAHIQWDKRFPLNLRVEQFLEAVASACERTGQEIVRLGHADGVMARCVAGKRKGSKLQELRELLLRRPVVSARMIRKELKVSPEGVSYLVKELGPVPREITGRRSYRVWGV